MRDNILFTFQRISTQYLLLSMKFQKDFKFYP